MMSGGPVKINECSHWTLMVNLITLLPLEIHISWYFVHYLPISENLSCVEPRTASLDLAIGTSLRVPAGPGPGCLPA